MAVPFENQIDHLEHLARSLSSATPLSQLESNVRRLYLDELQREINKPDMKTTQVVRFINLIGTLIRKRAEWQAASEYFLTAAEQFPEAFLQLAYDGALTAIDSGNYHIGQNTLLRLAPRLKELGPRQLRGIWRAAPLVGLHSLAIEAFHLSLDRGIEPGSSGVEKRLEQAQIYAQHLVVQNVNLLSLGENCLPWQLGQRWGLRSATTMLNLQGPFNLAQTGTNGVTRLLRDGLEGLVDSRLLTTVPQAIGAPRPVNATYNFNFNHEAGPTFTSDDYKGLKSRYLKRIADFKRAARTKPSVYLHYTEGFGDLNQLYEAVEQFTNSRFHIIIFDAWGGTRDKIQKSKNMSYYKTALPRPDYLWFRPDDYDSLEGCEFEARIASLIFECMREQYNGE